LRTHSPNVSARASRCSAAARSRPRGAGWRRSRRGAWLHGHRPSASAIARAPSSAASGMRATGPCGRPGRRSRATQPPVVGIAVQEDELQPIQVDRRAAAAGPAGAQGQVLVGIAEPAVDLQRHAEGTHSAAPSNSSAWQSASPAQPQPPPGPRVPGPGAPASPDPALGRPRTRPRRRSKPLRPPPGPAGAAQPAR